MRKLSANMPGHFRSSSPVRPAGPRSPRFREINASRWSIALLCVAMLTPPAAPAATPSSSPAPKHTQRPIRIDVTKVQPKSLLPKHAEHTEYVVEINKLGQVARVRSSHASDSATFNAQTYGNALQAFIRTPDGHVVLGIYRLTYDFDPKTARVRRDVSLLQQGGVSPDAAGAAMLLINKAHGPHIVAPKFAPNPGSSIDPRSLPELQGVTEPTAAPSPH